MNDIIETENPFGQRAVATQDTSGARQSQSRELAEIQAMAIMAKRYPRDQIAAYDRIMTAFQRVGLAEQAAYQYAKGGSDVSGASIRAAEALSQAWGNISTGFSELSRGYGEDGVRFSEVKAFAWDMEGNNPKSIQFFVRHWRDTRQGGYALKDERDIYELVANQAQRRLRNCILALIPGDVTEAAMKQAEETLKIKADVSPEAMAKMVLAFEAFGVTKQQIELRLQRHIDAIQPAQVVQLRRIYASLQDGMSQASEWFESPEAPEGDTKPKTGASALKAAATKPAAKKPAKDAADKGAIDPVDNPEAGASKAAAKPEAKEAAVTRPSYAVLADQMNKAKDRDDADLVLDSARHLPADQMTDLVALGDKRFPRT